MDAKSYWPKPEPPSVREAGQAAGVIIGIGRQHKGKPPDNWEWYISQVEAFALDALCWAEEAAKR